MDTFKNQSSDQSVYWLLMKVMFQAKHIIMRIADAHGLTLMQVNALHMLEPNEPMPMNVISTVFMCDASNVTGIIDRLEKQGFITRQDHPTDRRIKMINLTAGGITLKNKMMAEVIAAESKRLEPIFKDSERQTLHDLLQRIVSTI